MKIKLQSVVFGIICSVSFLMGLGTAISIYQWQNTTVPIIGNQVAKRTQTIVSRNCSHDGFFLIVDSQYGVVEFPVSYYTYMQSSNDAVHSFKVGLLTLKRNLDDTSKLQEDYPIIKYENALLIFWMVTMIWFFWALLAPGLNDDYLYWWCDGFLLLGIILGVFYNTL